MVKMCFQFLFALLVALQMGSNLVEANYNDYEDGGSLFSSNNVIEMPESCKGKPFCFEEGDYPYDMMDKLVENLRDMELEEPEAPIGIDSRSGNGATNGPLECKSNFTDSPIYYITDTNNKERVVVQSRDPGNFRQIYTLTWCLEDGPTTETAHFLKLINCVTKTMELDFFVLSENYVSDTPKMTVARASIPVCCRCQLDTEEKNRQFEQNRLKLMTDGISHQA